MTVVRWQAEHGRQAASRLKLRIGNLLRPWAFHQEESMKKYLIKVGQQFTEIMDEGKPEGSTMDTGSMIALALVLVMFLIIALVTP